MAGTNNSHRMLETNTTGLVTGQERKSERFLAANTFAAWSILYLNHCPAPFFLDLSVNFLFQMLMMKRGRAEKESSSKLYLSHGPHSLEHLLAGYGQVEEYSDFEIRNHQRTLVFEENMPPQMRSPSYERKQLAGLELCGGGLEVNCFDGSGNILRASSLTLPTSIPGEDIKLKVGVVVLLKWKRE